jgi:hypothetical protein
MQPRGFRLLLGATIVVVAGAIFALVRGDRGISAAAPGAHAFPELGSRLGDLAWVRLSRGSAKVDFAAICGRWVLVGKGNYPAALDRMRRLLLGLADLGMVEPKTERPELFARLDLDDPANGKSTLVALRDRGGKTIAELVVGKVRHIARQTERAAGQPGSFTVADPPAEMKFKGPTVLAEPAAALAGLDLDDMKPAAELPVPQDGVATAVFTGFDGLTVALRLFAHDNADWVAIEAAGSAAAEPDSQAINTRIAHRRYAIPAGRAKLLRTRLADLVEPAKG